MLRQIQSNGAGQLQASSTGHAPPMAYHEFYRDDFRPREHYLPMWEHIQTTGQQISRGQGQGGPPDAAYRRGHLYCLLESRRGDRAGLALRYPAAHHHRRRVGSTGGGAQAADPRPEPVPEGSVPRPAHPEGRGGTPGADLPRQGLPSRDHGHRSAPRHLHPHQRGRSDPRRGGPLPGPGGQPAHPLRGLLHDREPDRGAAHPPGVLRPLPGAAGGALSCPAAPGPALPLPAWRRTRRPSWY